MALEYLIENSRSLNAASWSGSGFADAATLVIDQHTGIIDQNLDRAADTTDTSGGINYLHVRADAVDIGGEAGVLEVEFDDTYTARASFVWATRGGRCRLKSVGDTVPWVEINGGGDVFLLGGDFKEINVGRGRLHISEACTFHASATVNVYGGEVNIAEHSGATDTLPTLNVAGGTVNSKRTVDAFTVAAGMFRLRALNTAPTSGVLWGGRTIIEAGDVPTFSAYGCNGAVLDLSQAIRDTEIGGTALVIAGQMDVRRYGRGAAVTLSNESSKVPIQS